MPIPAAQFGVASGLARSSLIHYETLGLLLPAVRSETGYCLYGEALLENRMFELGMEVARLRAQQRMLAWLPATPEFRHGAAGQGKAAWVNLLRSAGPDDADMHQWHIRFEADSPDRRAAFLASLGLAPDDLAAIRQWSSRQRQAVLSDRARLATSAQRRHDVFVEMLNA